MSESENGEPQVERDGFAWVPQAVSREECASLLNALAPVVGAGRRGLLHQSCVSDLAHSDQILSLIRPYFDAEPFAVRAIYFDKSTESNWLVPWHQDLTIAVDQHKDVPGFGPWSEKGGIQHVQPPVEILQRMLTVRLHLDAADETNGALRVIAGSHRQGRLSAALISDFSQREPEVICVAEEGSALLMRPLLLHSSRRAVSPSHRRILHLEYAAFSLPGGLKWGECAGH